MRSLKRLSALVLCFALGSTIAQSQSWGLPTPEPSAVLSTLLPYPERIESSRTRFDFSRATADLSGVATADRGRVSAALKEALGRAAQGKKGALLRVAFERCDTLPEEGYTLRTTPGKATIAARSFAGFFNALQTLRQLIEPTEKGTWGVECCSIYDRPAFAVRGVMIDVGRNYIEMALLRDIAHRLSHYKINMLHLHLTDDPGWRIEIKGFPQLNDPKTFWPHRQPGKFYTQQELKQLVAYCDSLGMRVLPEVDMPGHSQSFEKAMGFGMQTEAGISALQQIVDQLTEIFPDPWLHIGSDEVRFTMPDFMPRMIDYVRSQGRKAVVWSPGYMPKDQNAIAMCWGENEKGHRVNKSLPHIDCNGFYIDYMDAQSGVYQAFFQQPCEVARGDSMALGSVACVWTDGALSSGQRILEQYPFYPVALTFAERIWRGSREKHRSLMANLPADTSAAGRAFGEFETRLIDHRDRYFADQPFAYVRQGGIRWRLVGPFNHQGKNDTSFDPERVLQSAYRQGDTTLRWSTRPAWGGAIHVRNIYDVFSMHSGRYRLGHWPTLLSDQIGKNNGTVYALTCIESPKEQEVYLMVGINGMWGHSGGYRTAPAPEQGSWDFSGGDLWLNGTRVDPPRWGFESLPWTDWGKGRIEEAPLTTEGYFYRPPIKVQLKKGINTLLVRSVFGHWKGDTGQRKWQFCCMVVDWDGQHYTEPSNGIVYLDPSQVLEGLNP